VGPRSFVFFRGVAVLKRATDHYGQCLYLMALNNHIFTVTFTMDLEKQSQLFREVVAVGSRMRQLEPVHTRMWTMLVDPRQMIQTAKRNLRGDLCAVRPEDDKCPMILLEKAKRLVFGSGRGAEGKDELRPG
jgi:hypothetical protein